LAEKKEEDNQRHRVHRDSQRRDVDGWSLRSCGVQLGVTIEGDSGVVLRVATGFLYRLGLLKTCK
jgi:hypothetical protein